jgi:hypothetical protein
MTQQNPTNAGSAPSHADAVRLKRTLGLWSLVIIGMVMVQPTAPMGIYGVISNKGHGHVVTTVLIAMVAMLFTAVSYGRMARVYPSAGSAYTYVGQEMHSALGYIVGWGMVMDYILGPLICIAFCAKAAMNIVPGLSSFYVWILIFAALFTWLNLRGIRTSAQLNEALCTGMVVVVILFLVAVTRSLWHVQHDPGFFTHPFYQPETFSLPSIFSGTSVAVLTYIGFDAVSTLSEEVKNPRRNILLATVLVCLITGILSGLEVYAAQLVWGAKPFPQRSGRVGVCPGLASGRWRRSLPNHERSRCSSPTWVPVWARNSPPDGCCTGWGGEMRCPNRSSAPSNRSAAFRATTLWRSAFWRLPAPAFSNSMPHEWAEAPMKSAPRRSISAPSSVSWASTPHLSSTFGGIGRPELWAT